MERHCKDGVIVLKTLKGEDSQAVQSRRMGSQTVVIARIDGRVTFVTSRI